MLIEPPHRSRSSFPQQSNLNLAHNTHLDFSEPELPPVTFCSILKTMAATPEQIEHVRRLFAEAIPEVAAGTVELVGIGLEPGVLAMVVVRSKADNVDPLGACIGRRGQTIKQMQPKLKCPINVMRWSDQIKDLIMNVLGPVEIKWLEIDPETKQAGVYIAKPHPALDTRENNLRANLLSEITGYSVTVAEYF
jgi:transcription antitermination factor NusA-like protein